MLLADRLELHSPWRGGLAGAALGPAGGYQGCSNLCKDNRPPLFLWGLSFASCQGQTLEDYFLFWGIVVI